ncbi:UNVERIFIED_CONTAM: hypothetical protein NCL1_31605 [Trichonephila clavipes]
MQRVSQSNKRRVKKNKGIYRVFKLIVTREHHALKKSIRKCAMSHNILFIAFITALIGINVEVELPCLCIVIKLQFKLEYKFFKRTDTGATLSTIQTIELYE